MALCGYSAVITGLTATEVVSFDITLDVDAIDATSFSSNGHRERIPCVRGGTLSLVCIGARPNTGLYAGCTFKGNAADPQTISGDILIDESGISTPVENRLEFSVSAKFTGPITVNV